MKRDTTLETATGRCLGVFGMKHFDGALVLSDVRGLSHLIKEHPMLERFFQNPLLKNKEKIMALKDIYPYKVPAFMDFVLDTLDALHLTSHIPGILAQLGDYIMMARGRTGATVTSAHPLTPENKAVILDFLKKLTNQKIHLEENINAALLGGFVLQVDGKVYDASLARDLAKIEQAMKG